MLIQCYKCRPAPLHTCTLSWQRERERKESFEVKYLIYFLELFFLFLSLFPMACILLTPHKYDDVYMLNREDLPTNLNNKYHCIESVLACTFLWLWSWFYFLKTNLYNVYIFFLIFTLLLGSVEEKKSSVQLYTCSVYSRVVDISKKKPFLCYYCYWFPSQQQLCVNMYKKDSPCLSLPLKTQ